MAGGFFLGCKATVLVFLLAVAMAAPCVDASRSMPRSTTWPKQMGSMERLFGHYKLIPPSGPSERHNSIGQLETKKLAHKP